MGLLATLTGRKSLSRKPLSVGFAGSAIRWFLGLSGLYVLYAAGTFLALDDDFRMATRLGMALGSTTAALSLLVAPASFAAAARSPTVEGPSRSAVRRRVLELVLLAVGACVLNGLGPRLSSDLLYLDSYPPPEVVATSQIVESARLWVPSTVAIFTVLSGIAGGLMVRVTESWNPGRQTTTTWLSCLVLFLSFCLSLLLTTNLILHSGIAPAWILPGSLLLPTILIAGAVWRQADDLHLPNVLRRRRGQDGPHHRPRLDRVDRAVNPPADRPDEPAIAAATATRAELEMIHLAKGIRSVVGPSANLSPQRVDEIVNRLVDAPRTEATRQEEARRAPDRIQRPATVGQFCTNWACLAAVLLMVGMLGGVPPNLALAGLAGLLGSVLIRTTAAGTLSMAR